MTLSPDCCLRNSFVLFVLYLIRLEKGRLRRRRRGLAETCDCKIAINIVHVTGVVKEVILVHIGRVCVVIITRKIKSRDGGKSNPSHYHKRI
jgi:hypothetical protein